MTQLASETRNQQTYLASATGALAARREEIAALGAEKRRASAALDAETAAARAETMRLASEAETLRELLEGLAKAAPTTPSIKRQPVTPTPAKPAPAKPAPSKPQPGQTSGAKPSPAKPSAAPASVASRSAATHPLQPAVGSRLRRFGQAVNGEKQEGLTLATRAAAQVIAPLDARVQYAGVFRSYGLMVILDVGGDVLVVVSGLEALYPEPGQWVLAGEPIGRMADRKSPSPELYLEVRRKGQPVDPEKWLGSRT
jgi:septal ring factor EnvC (AmiA/AmiB activator)